MSDTIFSDSGRITIGTIQLGKIPTDTLFKLLLPHFQLAGREGAIAVIDGFEFAAIDRSDGFSKQFGLTAKTLACKTLLLNPTVALGTSQSPMTASAALRKAAVLPVCHYPDRKFQVISG